MMENNEKEVFNYKYSAKQQQEIESIRKKYIDKTEDKMEQLRRIDNGVTQKATVASLVIGIIGALVLGVGMSLAMAPDFAKIFGPLSGMALPIGIIIGIIGIITLSLAYPIYNRILKIEREKAASEVLRLTEELLK